MLRQTCGWMLAGVIVAGGAAGCNRKQTTAGIGPEPMGAPPADMYAAGSGGYGAGYGAGYGSSASPAQPATAAAPQPVFDPIAAPDAGPGLATAGGTYTIQRGDTLFSIARRVYGNGSRWRDIVAANPGLVPEKLRVGQTIVLP